MSRGSSAASCPASAPGDGQGSGLGRRVCSNCRKVLRQEKKIRVSLPLTRGPSAFIPEKEVMQANSLNERMHLLLEEYSTSGRLDNITRVMSLHTQYLESFLRSQFYVLRMDGPLPLPYRHYIAIMAAARHQCSYLINMHVDEFLKTGGIPEWLNGLEYVPQRLKNLNEINKLLAHRPWLVSKEHIQQLVKTGENNWSLPELVHAVVLLAHYHALASFVFGSGINPERDLDTSNGYRLISVNNFCVCDLANDNNIENASLTSNNFEISDSLSELEALMDRMKRLQEEKEEEEEEASQEEMDTRFEKEKTESLLVVTEGTAPCLLQFSSFRVSWISAFDDEISSIADVSRYVEDPGFGYKDFGRRGDLPTFRAQDYTWENHGFSLVNRLYSDIGHLLDEKFRMVYNLTYNTMATHEDVDTTMLRRALFNYVHCMYGIRYDDYDYGEVNQLLERNLKVYIKTVTCYPERTTKRMYDAYWRQFKHSEKVHVNLLLMEARMQAELLYALRAITRHLT
ncbi:sestrin-3 isoform X1 [Anolis sagrei]|uniref:sestrin-3 isoform X1 n=1 Tax=Anolis sagrei TaxID=38937 RepID=UPI00295C2E89|nr:sestrin-3 isoform X1 [Anolis sagrei ordinatus]